MNLQSTIELYGGGPGSGCTGPNCGRPPSNDSIDTKNGLVGMLEDVKKKFGDELGTWSKLAEFGHPGKVQPFTKGELTSLESFKGQVGNCKIGFCYQNSQRLALAGLDDKRMEYIEGLVTVHGVPIDHSWVEFNGKVYDPTLATYKAEKPPDYTKGGSREGLQDDETPEYFGIVVPKDEILKNQLKTKMYSPISHYRGDDELMKKIWKK